MAGAEGGGRDSRICVALGDCPAHNHLVGMCPLTPHVLVRAGNCNSEGNYKGQERLFFSAVLLERGSGIPESQAVLFGVLFGGRRSTEFLGFPSWTP